MKHLPSSFPRPPFFFFLLSFTFCLLAFGSEVGAIKFKGNRSFSSRHLSQIVQVKPKQPISDVALEEDVRALENFYRSQGFFNARVEKGVGIVSNKKVITFHIMEGERARIGAITIQGNRAFPTSRLTSLLPFVKGNYFTFALLEAGTGRLRQFYLNSGYPFVQVSDTFELNNSWVAVQFFIEEGPECYIKDVQIRGNRAVASGTIWRTAEVQKGERFSRAKLEEAQRRLYATKLFSRVVFYVYRTDSISDSVTVRFDVIEQEQRGVALGLGLQTPPSRALFEVEWEHNNVLNRGQWLVAGSSFSPDLRGNYRVNFDITYRIPYLFWTRVDFQTHPFFYYERLDSSRQREYGVETGMSRDLFPQLRLSLFNRLRLVADTSQGITNSLALSMVYDSRDNFFEPQRGFYIQPGLEVAGGIFLGHNDFVRTVIDTRWYQALGPVVFAARGLAGRIEPYGRTSSLPYYEEFSLGGRNNLRGYPDRALGPDSAFSGRYGPVIVNSSFELRGPYFFRWVGLVGFLDLGQVAGKEDIFLRKLEAGAGVGIRVHTPLGPLRLDWGKRLKTPPPNDWGKLYLGVLHAF
ncbi:MAG: POTRA domain-containing protein [candidate division WOR-3 bacterium]